MKCSKFGSRSVKRFSPLSLCLLLLLSLASRAFCGSELKCGMEYRLCTKDSIIHQGNLRVNNGTMLILDASNGGMLQLSDVDRAFRVERHTFEGVLAGSVIGGAIGLYIAKEWSKSHPSGEWLDMDLTEKIGGTIVGAVVGGIIGGLLGHIPSLKEIGVEMLPICEPTPGDITPVTLRIAYEF